MAKTKEEYKAPETFTLAGDGLEDVTVSFKLPEVKDDKDVVTVAAGQATIKVRLPKDAAGLKAIQSAVNAKHDGKGNQPLIVAYRNSAIELAKAETVKAHKLQKDLPDVLTLDPMNFPEARVTDEIKAMGSQIMADLASGKIKPEDLAALYASKVAK